jgi:hypothetical protein
MAFGKLVRFSFFSCHWEEESTMRRIGVVLAASVVVMLGIVLAAQAGDGAQKGDAAQKGAAVQKGDAAQKGDAVQKGAAQKCCTATCAPKKSREKLCCRAKTRCPKERKVRGRAKTCCATTSAPEGKGPVQKGAAQK